MAEAERTEWSTPIPLRDNGSDPQEGERPNPWSRLEAVAAARERLGWLAEHLTEHWESVSGRDVGQLVDQVAEELHQAIWGLLPAVERVRHRVPRTQLQATWDDRLDPAGPL